MSKAHHYELKFDHEFKVLQIFKYFSDFVFSFYANGMNGRRKDTESNILFYINNLIYKYLTLLLINNIRKKECTHD